MWNFVKENVGSIIVIVILAVIVTLIVVKLVKDGKKGKCSGCPYSEGCSKCRCEEKTKE